MRPIPPLSVSPYLYLAAICGDIKIRGSDKLNQSREIWQFIMGLTTQSGIVLWVPSSGQILIVQAGGAFTWEELSLAAPVFLAIMTWVGSREGHIQRQSSKPALSDVMLVNDCYAQYTLPWLRDTPTSQLRWMTTPSYIRYECWFYWKPK